MSSADALKPASKRAIQKIVEKTGDSIANKFAIKFTKVSKISPKTVKSKIQNMVFDKEMPSEKKEQVS